VFGGRCDGVVRYEYSDSIGQRNVQYSVYGHTLRSVTTSESESSSGFGLLSRKDSEHCALTAITRTLLFQTFGASVSHSPVQIYIFFCFLLLLLLLLFSSYLLMVSGRSHAFADRPNVYKGASNWLQSTVFYQGVMLARPPRIKG